MPKLRSWLQLIRVPNLFTVPGDPLAGFLLAYGAANNGHALLDSRAAMAVLASLCLYSAGLVLNDLLDLEEDRRERPDRPLPSGAVPVRAAKIVCGVLTFIGLVAMTLVAGTDGSIAAIALTLCIGFYNGFAKRVPVLGALMMGACRGGSVMLGSVACLGKILPIPVPVFAGAVGITLYIAAVTNLARHETRASAPLSAKLLPIVPVVLLLMLAHRFTGPVLHSFATTAFAMALVFVATEEGKLFREVAPPLPPIIGGFIRALLPLQAALCVVFPWSVQARYTAIALLVLLPIARWAGQRFYAS